MVAATKERIDVADRARPIAFGKRSINHDF